MNINKLEPRKKSTYLLLHLSIFIFSFTGVFSKLAACALSDYGLQSLKLYAFIFLMILNCFIYALAWQINIEKISLSVAYAHRSVYILWSQLWAVLIFSEKINGYNVAGMLLVLLGIVLVQKDEK